MICSKCNRNLPDDSEFCQYCGNKIEKSEPVDNSNVVEPEILADSEPNISDISLEDILKFQAKATIEAMNANAETQPDNEGDEDFGLVPEKPIFTLALKSVDGEEEYLNKLRTTNGERIRYSRRGSTFAAGINGMIDIYDTYLSTGELYKTIYINMYGATASVTAPQGFMFAEKNTKTAPVVESPKVIAKKRYCSHCGSLIDGETKVCTGCGNQYFKGIKYIIGKLFSKQHIALVIVSFVLFISLIVNIVLAVNVADLDRAYQINREKVEEYEKDLYYYEHVVFVLDNGTETYHKASCYRFRSSSSSFWAFNTEYAEYLGYSPCWLCCD